MPASPSGADYSASCGGPLPSRPACRGCQNSRPAMANNGSTPTRPSAASGSPASSAVALPGRAALHELRESLLQRRLVRQDVEHTAPLERRSNDPLEESGRDIDTAMSDAVVVRRWRLKAFGALLGRDAGRRRVHGDRGIVVHPQHAPGVDRWAEAAHEATGRRGAVPTRNFAQGETG